VAAQERIQWFEKVRAQGIEWHNEFKIGVDAAPSPPVTPPSSKLILGTGSGRCGTTSLARLLAFQPETTSTHELSEPGVSMLAVPTEDPAFVFGTFRDVVASRSNRFNADCAFYWLGIVDRLVAHYGDRLRIVCLERPRDEVVASFERKAAPFNHWQHHDGTVYQHIVWDQCFPKFPQAQDRREAIGLYWDHCQALATDYATRHPRHFRRVPMSDLNDPAKVDALLRWCGYEKPVVAPVQLNRMTE
jgi:hypothetical protein